MEALNKFSTIQSLVNSLLSIITILVSGVIGNQTKATMPELDNSSLIRGENNKYYYRYLFDLTYLIILIIIFMEVIFGIIIDTFGELRDEKNEQIELFEETCYICGIKKSIFEMQ